MATKPRRDPYGLTGWYVAVVLVIAVYVEGAGSGWPPSVADCFRWITLAMFLAGSILAIRDVFARRGTTHAFVLLLGAINYIAMGALIVLDRLQNLGEPMTTFVGASFAAVAIGLWCFVIVNSHRFESGVDRQEDVDFWHPDQEAPKGG